MHQRRPHLSAHLRRTILAALVLAGGAAPLAAEEPRESIPVSNAAPAAESNGQSTLKLRLARRPWLDTATAAGPQTEAEASPTEQTGQPKSPELAGSPQSPRHWDETAPEPLEVSEPMASGAADEGWVVRGSVETRPAPVQPTETDQLDAGRSRAAAGRASSDAPATERLGTVPSAAAEEVQQRLEKVVVRRLRVGRDGSLLGQASDDLPERSSRDSRGPATAPPPADDGSTDSHAAANSASSAAEERAEPEPAPAVELDYTGRPAEPIEVTSKVRRMQPTLRRCLQYYFDRPEQAPRRSNWGVLHAIMVYGVDTPILAGRQSYSAIAWIAGNNICRGKRLLRESPTGIEAASGIGLQGHQAQALAVFALVGVPADYPLYAGRSKYSVEDLVQAEARACRSGEELTFSLIGLSHYLDTDATWTGADGEGWDFERLIREELAQPIVGVTCGGTHRLMGFAHALRQRRIEGRPIEGQWLRAEMYLEEFVDYTYRLQNRDGSMSTNWFEGREDNGDLDRKVQTTGHMVEFLLTVTPDSELQNPKLVAAVQFLLDAMDNGRDHEWSIGPKGHALRSLAMYYQRVYDEGTPWQKTSTQATTRSGASRRR